MPQTVTARIQLAVSPLLIKAAGSDAFWMGCHLRFKQLGIALIQRVWALALIAPRKQKFALAVTQQGQLRHIAFQPVHQRQQQTLEFGQQTLNAAAFEVALVIRQVQAQVIAGIAHGRQREVGVGAPRVRRRLKAVRPIHDRHVDRRVLEHKQAVEQRLTFWQLAALLNRDQRQVFVLTQLHVVFEQVAQPLTHSQRLALSRHLHAQGHAVDEQTDRVLHLRQFHRATGHGHAKQYVALAAKALQH